MINWLLRPLIGLSGIVTGWFFTAEGLRFTIIQSAVGMLLAVGLIAIAAFWPERWTDWLTGRRSRPD